MIDFKKRMKKEKKPLNLSFTKIDTYLSCPRKYKLQYIDYITASYIPTPFIFGGAVDDATSHILFDKAKGDLHIPFNEQNMIDDFKNRMEHYKFQLEDISIPTSPLVKYAKADIDISLLNEQDISYIRAYADTHGVELDSLEEFCDHVYAELKKGREKVDVDLLSIYNLMAWRSLYNKGLMMLTSFKKWADENIKEVHSIQKKIEIANEEGNKLIGLLDFEATMMDGVRRTMDLKTASNAVAQYPDGCIDTSKQLHIYSQESNKEVGYVVIDKDIRKKEPRVRIRTVLGEVTEEMLDETFETIDNVMVGIQNNEFEMNKDNCFQYGGCAYRGLCHYNSMKGLEKRKFEEKK